MVSPSPALRGPRGRGRRRRERARQPQDIREGVTNAYHLVKEVKYCNINFLNILFVCTGPLL